MAEKINEIHRKNCDKCLKFQIGSCGGIRYHVPPIVVQPLCETVQREYAKS